jgi:hypothetical protein
VQGVSPLWVGARSGRDRLGALAFPVAENARRIHREGLAPAGIASTFPISSKKLFSRAIAASFINTGMNAVDHALIGGASFPRSDFLTPRNDPAFALDHPAPDR